MKNTSLGLDPGNTRFKVCIGGKSVSIPASYATDEPEVIRRSGQRAGQQAPTDAFSLLFKDKELWFGNDVLASQNRIQKLNASKYNPDHLSILFRAALYAWGKKYKIPLSQLGRLNIVASMPPGLYADQKQYNQALKAYRAAFNRGQSHVKIRDGKETVQIVTRFLSLEREAVLFGAETPRKNEIVLVLDLGGETNDIAVFNGSPEPFFSKTYHSGLLHLYSRINPGDPASVEHLILRGEKKYGDELASQFNRIENLLHLVNGGLPKPIDKIIIIGGGVRLMANPVKDAFRQLAKTVIFKNEFANAEANSQKAQEILK